MTSQNTSYMDLSTGSRLIFLYLLGLWSASQLISVLAFLPFFAISILYNLKNILGATVVAWSLLVILSQFLQHKVISFDKNLYFLAILFPFYVTLIDIVNYEISWQEVLLYWLWVTAVYLVFPVILQDEQLRRKAINVLFWTNLLILFVGIFLGILKGSYYVVEHGNRMVFYFMHPNYYCNSWLIIFAISFYYTLTVRIKLLNYAALAIMPISLMFMLLAKSRNTLVSSIILIVVYVLLNRRWSFFLKFTATFFMLSALILLFLLVNPSVSEIDKTSSGRLSIWKMTLASNLNKASAMDYLLGIGRYKVVGFDTDPAKIAFRKEHGARDHVDNAYLDIFLQNGVIGFVLFFLPILIIMRRTMVNAISAADDLFSRQARIAFAFWVGVLIQMGTTSIIPSFGNVINIYILVSLTPMASKLFIVRKMRGKY